MAVYRAGSRARSKFQGLKKMERALRPSFVLFCVLTASVTLGFTTSLVGCSSSNKKKKVIKECVRNEDQASMYMGKWSATPVPIAVKASQFNAEELSALTEAVAVWNDFFQASKTISVLDAGSGTVPTTSASLPSTACLTGIMGQAGFTGQVAIYKQGAWPNAYTHSAIAITNVCHPPGVTSEETTFFNATMELNYQDFFVSGKRVPDLKSIFIHELGHLLGMDHSCDAAATTTTGRNSCRTAGAPDLYLSAVMFPVVQFYSDGTAESRVELGDNDMGRANCLYGAQE